MRSIRPQSGFTIIETLVAMTITLVMLFLIHTLFQTTSQAVSLGVGFSDIIGTSRAIGDQIELDAKHLLGPSLTPTPLLPPGVMVIICEKLPPTTTTPPTTKYRQKNGATNLRYVRVDQFLFMRGPAPSTKPSGQNRATPIAPASDATFSPPLYSQINGNGNPVTAIRVYYGHGVATDPDGSCPSPTLGVAGSTNEVATFWPLCRHALFFLENATNATAPGAINVAGSPAHDASVTGITHPVAAVDGAKALYHGMTDVTRMGYFDSTNTNGTYLSSTDTGRPLHTDQADGAYRTAAIGMTYNDHRLWVNKVPEVNVTAPLPSGLLAQMHPIIAENCSDFIVEFAGDYVDDLPTGAVDGLEDGGPDVDNQGEIKWYGLEANAASNSYAFPIAMPAWFGTTVPVTVDPKGTVGSAVAYVFRHDQPKQWPHLIRIRYRLHDKRGELQGSYSPEVELAAPDVEGKTGTNYGRWFEQIFKVNR